MLDQKAVLDADDVRRDPVHGKAEVRKSPMHDHEVLLGHDRSWFILQCRRDALDEMEQTLTTGPDMGAVLNVIRGPVALSRCVVPFVEQSVKGFENQSLVLFFFRPV